MKKSISPYSVAEKAIDRKRKGLSGGRPSTAAGDLLQHLNKSKVIRS